MPTETPGIAKCQQSASRIEVSTMRAAWMLKIIHNSRRGSEKTRLESATIVTEISSVSPADHITVWSSCAGMS